jgi:hypothetical protein
METIGHSEVWSYFNDQADVGARPIFLRRARRGNTQGMEPVLMD